MISRLAAVATDRMHLWLMLVLTFTTGVIDAVGYLGFDKVFTGNMTGNVVILGMALAGGDDLPILGPFLALVGFMVGAAVGGRVLKDARAAWTHRTTVLFASVGLVTLTLAILILVIGEHPPEWVGIIVTTLLGAAMGTQAATARFIAVKDVTTVVVTSTITGLAADSALGSGKRGASARRFWAVVLILAGAALGALLLQWHLGAGMAAAGALIVGVTVIGALHVRFTDRPARPSAPTVRR